MEKDSSRSTSGLTSSKLVRRRRCHGSRRSHDSGVRRRFPIDSMEHGALAFAELRLDAPAWYVLPMHHRGLVEAQARQTLAVGGF